MNDLMEGIVSIVVQFRKNTWTIGCVSSTVLAVYRVQSITWSERGKNFEISRKSTKFRLNRGINVLLGYKFG